MITDRPTRRKSLGAQSGHTLTSPQRHSDSYILAFACLGVLLAVTLDPLNVLGRGTQQGGSSARYLVVAVPTAVALALTTKRTFKARAFLAWPDFALFLLTTWGLLGAIYGRVVLHQQNGALPFFLPMTIGLLHIMMRQPLSASEARSLFRKIGTICFTFVLLDAFGNSGISTTISNADSFRHWKAYLLALALLAATTKRRSWRVLIIIGLIAYIYLAYKAATYPLTFIVASLTLLTTRRRGHSIKPRTILALAAVSIVTALLWSKSILHFVSTYFAAVGKSDNSGARLQLLTAGYHVFQRSPIFGSAFTGTMAITAVITTTVQSLPVHNDFLEMMMGGGIIALMLFVTWIVMTNACIVRRYRRYRQYGLDDHADLLRLLLVGFNTFLVISLFNPVFENVGTSASFFALYAIMMGCKSEIPNTDTSTDDQVFGLHSPTTGIPTSSRLSSPTSPAFGDLSRAKSDHLSLPAGISWSAGSSLAVSEQEASSASRNVGRPTRQMSLVPSPSYNACSVNTGSAPKMPVARGLDRTSPLRSVIKGTSWALSGRALSMVALIGVNSLLARTLSPSSLGAYLLVSNIVLVASVIAQLGLRQALVRLIAESVALNSPGRARAVIRRAYMVAGCGVAATGSLLIGFGHQLNRTLFDGSLDAGLVLLGVALLVASSFQTLLSDTFRGFQQYVLASLFETLLTSSLLAVALLLFRVLHTHPSLGSVLLVTFGSAMCSVIIAGALVHRRIRPYPKNETIAVYDIMTVAWPLLIFNVAVFFLATGVDVLILGALRPKADVAIYGAASSVLVMVVTPLVVLNSVLLPIIAEFHAKRRLLELQALLRSSATFAAVPALAAFAVLLLLGGPILALVYGSFYRAGAMVLAILAVGQLMNILSGSCGSLLMMTGFQRTLMRITGACALLSVIGDVGLGLAFGSIGVAVATSVALTLQNGLALIAVKRKVGLWTGVRSPFRAWTDLRSMVGESGLLSIGSS